MKPWYQSKTIWFNVIGGVVVLLQYLNTIHIDSKWIIDALALGNLILRFKTDTGVRI